MESETEIGRKIKRLEREIELQDQVIKAYKDAFENPGDITTGIALGTALAALDHHDRNTAQFAMWEGYGPETLPPFLAPDEALRMDSDDAGKL